MTRLSEGSSIPLGPCVFARSFNRRDKSSRGFELDGLERELEDPDVFSWIDIHAADIGLLNATLRRLDIDLVLVGHFDEPEVLPRIVERTDCLAFYLYEVEDPELHLDTSSGLREIEFVRMILVLGKDFVLTFHRRELDVVSYVKGVCDESFGLWGKTPGFVAFLFLQRCLYDYAHLNLANDNSLDQLGDELESADSDFVSRKIAIAGQNVLTLKKLATSLQIVLMLLANKRSVFISEESRSFYQDMLHNAVSVRAAIDSSRDLLDGFLASIQAEAAQRTGEIARVLTVISAVILPLTLISGIYGMNFRHMPELEMTWGYFAVLALMGSLASALLLVFWRLGWLGDSAGVVGTKGGAQRNGSKRGLRVSRAVRLKT